MTKVIHLINICIALCLVCKSNCGTTVDQLMSAANLMKMACQPKFITLEQANEIKRGYVAVDRNVKCYMNCIMEMTKVTKKGKIQLEAAKKQIQIMVPDHMQEEWINGLLACKDAGAGLKDNCEVAYQAFDCFTSKVPSFVIP